MKIASNVTEKKLSTVFSKFAEEKALVLKCNMAYIANWYFGSDIYELQVMHYRKLFRLYSGKWKTAYCAIFKL